MHTTKTSSGTSQPTYGRKQVEFENEHNFLLFYFIIHYLSSSLRLPHKKMRNLTPTPQATTRSILPTDANNSHLESMLENALDWKTESGKILQQKLLATESWTSLVFK